MVEAEQRRVFNTMIARFKEKTSTVLVSVSSPAEALSIQTQMLAYGATLIHMAKGASGPGNPAKPPQKRRPNRSDNRAKSNSRKMDRGEVNSNVNVKEEKAANPQQRVGNSKRTKHHRNSMETRGSCPR
ncbi:unnamed protein product [Sphacelaria rigidula]